MAITETVSAVALKASLATGSVDKKGNPKYVTVNFPSMDPDEFDNTKAWNIAAKLRNITSYTLSSVYKTTVSEIDSE